MTRRECALVATALLLGALLRLSGLSDAALGAEEAAHAWPAARAASEGLVVADGITNALLTSLQAALFALAGPTTFLARLPAALCGLALILVPLFVKDSLGFVRVGALVALLATDATLVLVSRDASGASASLLAAALASAALLAWASAGRSDARRARAASVVASASLGLLVATGTEAWSLLPLVGLAAAVLRPWRLCAPRLRACATAFGATFALAATAGLWEPAWASGASASLTAWLERWARTADLAAVTGLLAAAPVTLVLALAGVAYAARRAPGRATALVAALIWSVLLALHTPAPAAPLAVVLVLAASEGAAALAQRARRVGLRPLAATAAAFAAAAQLALAMRPLLADPPIPSRPDLEVLAADLERIAAVKGRDASELPVLVLGERDDATLRWALRRGRNVRYAPHRPLETDGPRPALVARGSASTSPPPGYVGATYATSAGPVDLWVPLD